MRSCPLHHTHARPLTPFVLALTLFALPALASAQGAGTITKTSYGYAWQRGNLTQQLHDCGSQWTQGEADLMKQAFDRLPDLLIEHPSRLELEWRRSPDTRGRLGLKQKNASATTVVDGVPHPYISMSDYVFNGMNADRVYRTTIHELGHVAQFMLASGNRFLGRLAVLGIGTPGFTSISWTTALTNGLKSWNGFVSDYSRSGGDREDFAETVEFFWVAPDELQRVNPRKYQFMLTKLFQGQVSPASSRVAGARAIAPVTPEITSLGDTKDNAYSLVKIKGNYFMGPKDGGFNRVTYRGKRALRMAVSRSTIWSWVPNIATGSAPITVETQDGVSAPKPFEVTKPWWKW